MEAVAGLARLRERPPGAEEAVLDLVRHAEDPILRIEAARMLVRRGSVRPEAAAVLLDLARNGADGHLRLRALVVLDRAGILPQDAAHELARTTDTPYLCITAAQMLGHAGILPADVVAALLTVARDNDSYFQEMAIDCVVDAGPEVLDDLIELLGHRRPEVRGAARRVLVRVVERHPDAAAGVAERFAATCRDPRSSTDDAYEALWTVRQPLGG